MLTLLLLLLPAFATPWSDLEQQLVEVQDRRIALREAVETKGGFDSAAREHQVFVAALSAYVLGEWDEAALGFFVFLNMGAEREELLQDSEWYLADTLQHMGLTELSATRFLELANSNHPKADDALGALIQIRAVHGPADAFTALYQRLEEQGGAERSPRMSYLLGQALYQAGDLPRAAVAFAEVPLASSHGVRARYHVGVIALRDERLEQAREIFGSMESVVPENTAEEHALELALLAVARLDFQRDDHEAAADGYARLASAEHVLPESGVENLWNLVALKDWGSALLAFGYFRHQHPGHPEQTTMRLLHGHVRYQMGQFDQAEYDYEHVAFLLGSVVERLRLFDVNSARNRRILEDPELWRPALGLPPAWALSRFLDAPGVGKGLEVRNGVDWLEAEVASARELWAEVDDALAEGGAIGRFQTYRFEANTQLDILAQLRLDLLQAEVEQLRGGLGAAEARAFHKRIEGLRKQASDAGLVRLERFAAIQAYRLDKGNLLDQLALQDQEAGRQQLAVVKAELRRLEGERRKEPIPAEVFAGMQAVRAELAGRHGSTEEGALVGLLHDLLDEHTVQIQGLREVIDREETATKGPIQAILEGELGRLDAIDADRAITGDRVAITWERLATNGLSVAEASVTDGLQQAMAGQGDVVWNNLLDLRDQKQAIQERQRLELNELQQRFDLMKTRLSR